MAEESLIVRKWLSVVKHTIETSVFFSPVKKNIARESHFRPFWHFFHGQLFFFTGTFLPFLKIFHAQLFFLHGQFHVFLWFFHGQKITFTGKNLIFFTENSRFSALFFSHGLIFMKKNFTGNFFIFTGIFSIFFHGHAFFSRAKF